MSFLSLIKSPEARRLFGKRECIIIEKQLWGVNLTQSEKNRLSRSIRKKLTFVKELSRFEEHFALKKGTRVKDVAEEVKYAVLSDPLAKDVRRIILFGSTIENVRALRSDVDIAVEFSTITVSDATSFRIRMGGRVSEKADVQVFNVLRENIKKEVEQKGRVIFEWTELKKK